MRTTNRLASTCVLAVLFFLTASCSSPEVDRPDGAARYVGGNDVFSQVNSYRLAHDARIVAEEAVQQCMKAEGFDYEPRQPQQVLLPDAHQDIVAGDLTDLEFAERYGFGLTTMQSRF